MHPKTHLLSAVALMMLHAAGAHAQSCTKLHTCAQSAASAATKLLYFLPGHNGDMYLIERNPQTGGVVAEVYVDHELGSYAADREFMTADGSTLELRVRELWAPQQFVPSRSDMTELDFSQGATLAVVTEVRNDIQPLEELEIFGAVRSVGPSGEEPLLAFGQTSTGWFFKRRLQALGDTQSVMSTVLPWDPVPTEGDWVAIYLTFQPDGKLRIDQLSLIDGSWNTSLLEDGWPISDLGEADSSGNVSPVVHFDWHEFYLGTDGLSSIRGGRFAEVWVFERALTPDEILGDHWNRTGLAKLEIGMQPCNTGLYLNGTTVDTPCGPKSLIPE